MNSGCAGLNHLFNAFLTSIPKLLNVAMILLLLLFLFSVLGLHVFAKNSFIGLAGSCEWRRVRRRILRRTARHLLQCLPAGLLLETRYTHENTFRCLSTL